MTLEQLRLNHPRLVYKRYSITKLDGAIVIEHEFLLEPNIVFRPRVTIPIDGGVDVDTLRPYAFHLGLVEAISYWKAACPPEFVVEAGPLSPGQVRFWYDLFIHGLGEFFYRNSIDFTHENFFTITTIDKDAQLFDLARNNNLSPSLSDLFLVGGGKDSAVALGLLKKGSRKLRTMIVNPTKAALAVVEASSSQAPLVIERTIDPTLLELNAKGYLNGHTPFSAYLAFLGVTVAMVTNQEHVIVANEKSADEGNVVFHGMEINHQYSKSFRFEQSFRQYVAEFLPGSAAYFSLLRPLNDLQIAVLFAKYPQYYPLFRSCNVGSKTGAWCGTCAKCAFTYLVLVPFLSFTDIARIFGSDFFTHPEIIGFIRELVGLTPVKPFECVGTRDEARLAVWLSVQKYKKDGKDIPEGLLRVYADMHVTDGEVASLRETVLEQWGDTYNLPAEHLSLLKSAWQEHSFDV